MHSFDIHIPKDKLRVAQIISLSLPMGLFLFLAIACLISPFPPQLKITPDSLTLIVLIQAIATVPLAYIIPANILSQNARKTFTGVDPEAVIQKESENESNPKFYINRFMGHYQTSMIIGCALLEGSAVFGVVVYLLKNNVWDLVVAGAMILLMLTKIPTEGRLQSSLANLASRQKMKREL